MINLYVERPQENSDPNKIKCGRIVNCIFQHLEEDSLKFLFEKLIPLNPTTIVSDVDVKIAQLVKNIKWNSPVTLCLDLVHSIKNRNENCDCNKKF